MDTLALRLAPGIDLRLELERLARERQWLGAFVLCGVGSLAGASLRWAAAAQPAVMPGEFELLTLAGSLSMDGAHLHATVADAAGVVRGGHVCAGCVVRTTIELVIAPLAHQRLSREFDARTGFSELVIRPIAPA